MKKLTSILMFTFIITVPIFTQQEEEVLPPPIKHIVRMGGAGGFTPFLLFWDVSNLNESFPDISVPKLTDQPVLLYGGQGYGYIVFIENFRIGGMGASGSASSTSITGNTRRDLDVTVSIGGVTMEYAIPISERLDIVPGLMLGGGGVNVKIRRDNYGLKIWNDLIAEWGAVDSVDNFRRDIDGSFFVYQPSVNIEYAILRWLSFRVGVSYLGMVSPSWKLDEKFDVEGVPSKLNGKGLVINVGLFLGTFLF
ncbi:MAG: hypothetical protein ABIK27_00060 [Bacteroidota bacterium]